MDELRLKSNMDLHKLWFVLYKERNMLYTMQEAAKTECELFPSPERIDKVEESMSNLENVVRERNKAYWQLEVSPAATGERPSVYRRDIFGRPRWHNCSQHIVPYHRNWHFRNTQGPGRTNETDWFFNRYRELRRKYFNYARSKTARHLRDLFRRFPDADAEYIAELHPEFPQGYVKHLKENYHQYDDPPSKMARISMYPEHKA
jgi:large subunit ribosomal protein L47